MKNAKIFPDIGHSHIKNWEIRVCKIQINTSSSLVLEIITALPNDHNLLDMYQS